MSDTPDEKNRIISAVGAPRMLLGYNYTWGFDKFGWYFGPHWRPGDAVDPDQGKTYEEIFHDEQDPQKRERGPEPWQENWLTCLPRNLELLKSKWDIRIIRIFLLCNAQNLGTSNNSARTWAFARTLHPRFLRHLQTLFDTVRQKEMKVIPSILDFGVADPVHRWEKRHHIVTDPAMRSTFVEQIVTPFAQLGKSYRDVIYAWEVMNEPSWMNAAIWPNHTVRVPAASVKEINAFLGAVLERIKREDPQAKTTVGHRYYRDLDTYETGDLKQFHYYPSYYRGLGGVLDIVPLTDPERLPVVYRESPKPILGEIGATAHQGEPWLELDDKDIGSARNRIRERLLQAERKGYALTLIWPDMDWNKDTSDDHLKLSPSAQQGLDDFKARPKP
ncbi:hypothetical protein [Pendulispora albinea]|uniref:Glycoside hydrolase family 5 domain-containing protein n=1 Tax=Pendulispora albinea TaxID=2741071 RepID=A0ABZ2MB36_9BACT